MPPSLDSTLGAVYIGITLSNFMYGITCLQTYLYFTEHCGGDHRLLKMFVGFIMMVDTAQSAMIANRGYYYTITNFGNFDELDRTTEAASYTYDFAVGSLMSSAIQIFFAWRIYLLASKRLIIPTCIIVADLIKIGFAAAFAAQTLGRPRSLEAPLDLSLVGVALILDVVIDISIAVTMTYYLKSQSYVTRTKRAIKLLVIYTMNTCVLTSVFGLATAITYMVLPATSIFAPFYNIFIRLYVCSLLCLLNSRERIRQELHTGEMITLSAIAIQNSTTSIVSADATSHSRTTGSQSATVLAQQLAKEDRLAKSDV